MTTTHQNFEMYAGEDQTITVSPINDSAGDPYGDTAALTFSWVVRTSENATTDLITKATSSGITNGTSALTIALADTDTEDLAPGTYYHECRTTDAGAERVVFSGGMTLKASTTNP